MSVRWVFAGALGIISGLALVGIVWPGFLPVWAWAVLTITLSIGLATFITARPR